MDSLAEWALAVGFPAADRIDLAQSHFSGIYAVYEIRVDRPNKWRMSVVMDPKAGKGKGAATPADEGYVVWHLVDNAHQPQATVEVAMKDLPKLQRAATVTFQDTGGSALATLPMETVPRGMGFRDVMKGSYHTSLLDRSGEALSRMEAALDEEPAPGSGFSCPFRLYDPNENPIGRATPHRPFTAGAIPWTLELSSLGASAIYPLVHLLLTALYWYCLMP